MDRRLGASLLAVSLIMTTSIAAFARPTTAMEPALVEHLRALPRAPVDIVVRFDSRAHLDAAAPLFGDARGTVLQSLPVITLDVVSPEQVQRIARAGGVELIELADRIPLLMRTGVVASRARAVWGSDDGGPVTVNGVTVDGAGIGVAVLDTGIHALHPDLQDRVAGNYRVISDRIAAGQLKRIPGYEGPSTTVVDMPATDLTSGHGTHVAGIVAGSGAASNGAVKGAAPGASLYGFSIGEGLNVIEQQALAAFDWIIQNHDAVDPPIRVATNSWGSAGSFLPGSTMMKLVSQMIAEDISVLFAAGNGDVFGNGGNCSTDVTMSQSKHPAVISVAAYDDRNDGRRDGSLGGFSSRGDADDQTTWPDISAPGVQIYSAMDPAGLAVSYPFKGVDAFFAAWSGNLDPTTDPYNPYYVNFDGTSMATPMIAGIVALMRQANPSLTVTQIKDIIETTAFKFGSGYVADERNVGTTTSCDKGHGLIDARAAVEAALS